VISAEGNTCGDLSPDLSHTKRESADKETDMRTARFTEKRSSRSCPSGAGTRHGDGGGLPQARESALRLLGRLPRATETPTSGITPSTASTPPFISLCCAGSMSRALISASGQWAMAEVLECGIKTSPSLIRQMLRQGLENGDPNRDPHLDLLADEASWPIGDDRVDFHTSVHRAWVHDERIRLGIF
jgi:hypothetical protein